MITYVLGVALPIAGYFLYEKNSEPEPWNPVKHGIDMVDNPEIRL